MNSVKSLSRELSVAQLRKELGGGERLKTYVMMKSSMRLLWAPDVPKSVFDLGALQQLRIVVGGICSKFPSIGNSRLVRGYVDKGSNKVRGSSAPSPDYQVVMEVLTRLYRARTSPDLPEPSFLDDPKSRLFVTVQLSDSCSRIDSHNTLKSACDWIQSIGLVRNDRNLDALAFHKRDHGHEGQGFDKSEIVITRMDILSPRFKALACR